MGRLKILGGLLSIAVAIIIFLDMGFLGIMLYGFQTIFFVFLIVSIPAISALLGGILGIASRVKASIILTWITVGFYTYLVILSVVTSTPTLFVYSPFSLFSQWGVAIIITPGNIHIPIEYIMILLGAILLIVGRDKRIKR